MEFNTSSAISKTYIDGELIDKKGFITENDGDNTLYILNNNDHIITGNIDNDKLSENNLMEILSYSNPKLSLIKQLENDFPILDKTKQNKTKQNKNKNKKKTKKKTKNKNKNKTKKK